jgi:hypothetical protein
MSDDPNDPVQRQVPIQHVSIGQDGRLTTVYPSGQAFTDPTPRLGPVHVGCPGGRECVNPRECVRISGCLRDAVPLEEADDDAATCDDCGDDQGRPTGWAQAANPGTGGGTGRDEQIAVPCPRGCPEPSEPLPFLERRVEYRFPFSPGLEHRYGKARTPPEPGLDPTTAEIANAIARGEMTLGLPQSIDVLVRGESGEASDLPPGIVWHTPTIDEILESARDWANDPAAVERDVAGMGATDATKSLARDLAAAMRDALAANDEAEPLGAQPTAAQGVDDSGRGRA